MDTSVWVEHLRRGNAELAELLDRGSVLCHPYVIGELAMGNLVNRAEVLSLLGELPSAVQASHQEVMRLIDEWRLMGEGLGYIEAHLLASALLAGVPLFTLDRRLSKAFARFQ